jgi:hypothetical protein
MAGGGTGQDLAGNLRTEFELLAERVRHQREQTERLRVVADELEDRTAADERLLEQLAGVVGLSAQLCIDDLSPRLRGQRLQRVAVEVLRRNSDAGREIHYREWFDLVRADGHRVGGRDPLATFLAQVHRAPQVQSMGGRSGRFRLLAA